MYGEKTNKIGKRLEELEIKGETDTIEYKNLVEKWNKIRKEDWKSLIQTIGKTIERETTFYRMGG